MSFDILQAQLSLNSIYDSYIPKNTYIFHNVSIDFNYQETEINHRYNMFLPNKIVCYNCSDNFNIKKITLTIGGNHIIKFDTEIMNGIVNFVEDIYIDDNLCKIYHLDRTKLFFDIRMVALQYQQAHIIIDRDRNSECNNIKLLGKGTNLNYDEKIKIAREDYKSIIRDYKYCKINYKQGTEIKTKIYGKVNGFILSNLNINNIKSIKIKLSGFIILNYSDKIEILLNTKKINDKCIYVNFNDSNYMDLLMDGNIECKGCVSFIIESEDENIDLHLSTYSGNILRYTSGMAGLVFELNNYIILHEDEKEKKEKQKQILKNELVIGPLIGNDICPVLKDKINNKYISCSVCKYNFDHTIYDNWIKNKKICPHCKQTWTNYTLYELKT
jgi:hypothetical protein